MHDQWLSRRRAGGGGGWVMRMLWGGCWPVCCSYGPVWASWLFTGMGRRGRGKGGRTRNNSVENCSRVMADGERGGAAAGAGIGAGPALASQL